MHRPRTLLGERLNDLVRGTLGEVDVVGFCLPADQKIGPGDRFVAEDLPSCAGPPRPEGVASSPRSTWWGGMRWPST